MTPEELELALARTPEERAAWDEAREIHRALHRRCDLFRVQHKRDPISVYLRAVQADPEIQRLQAALDAVDDRISRMCDARWPGHAVV